MTATAFALGVLAVLLGDLVVIGLLWAAGWRVEIEWVEEGDDEPR